MLLESSTLVTVLFREVFSHPFISFFHLLVTGLCVTSITSISIQTSFSTLRKQLILISMGSYFCEVRAFGTFITFNKCL